MAKHVDACNACIQKCRDCWNACAHYLSGSKTGKADDTTVKQRLEESIKACQECIAACKKHAQECGDQVCIKACYDSVKKCEECISACQKCNQQWTTNERGAACQKCIDACDACIKACDALIENSCC